MKMFKRLGKLSIYVIKETYKFLTYYPTVFVSRHLDYFHYKILANLCQSIFTINPGSGFIGNKCYGNLWAIKKAMGENFDNRCMIEHGLYFGEYVLEDECMDENVKTIYTYSEYRKKAIMKWMGGDFCKHIVPVGPYLAYANYFKDEDKLKKMKQLFGRTLLVFPTHQSPKSTIGYDIDAFLDEIDKIASDFDTIMVSLFWADIKRGMDKVYKTKGYKIVTSGTRSDRWFLSRLKDLFYLSDYSMSNNVGTHVGYSIAMGVPHYIFRQRIEITGNAIEFKKDEINNIRDREYDGIIEAFGSYNTVITNQQREIVNYYWGLDCLR